MNSEEAKKLSQAARRFERDLTDVEPSGDAAMEASVLATMLERFASGASKLNPLQADAVFASHARIILSVATAYGVPISFELSKWGRFPHMFELAAYCDEQAQGLSSLAPEYSGSLSSQAKQYRLAALSLVD